MSRKLKKRIRELCSLDRLTKDERIKRCQDLLRDNDAKQNICLQAPGLTFKVLDRVLRSEINSRRPPSEEELIYNEIQESQPEKLDPEIPLVRKKKAIKQGFYTKKETLELINAESVATRKEESTQPDSFDTYSPEDMKDFLND